MEPSHTYVEDHMEVSMTGSTGASTRTGMGGRSRSTRPVASKYLSSTAASSMTARKDATGREPLHLRAGGSVALATSTPAQPLVPGRSLNLEAHLQRTGNALTSRTLLARTQNNSPGRDVSVGSAASKCGQPGNLASRMEEVKQEDRREALQRYLDSKRQGYGATAPSGPAPRVPTLNMAALQAAGAGSVPGAGSSTARISGSGAAPAAAAPPNSARGNYAGLQQQQQMRAAAAAAPVSARGSSGPASAAARARYGAGVVTAMAPPPPRGPAVVVAAADPQVLQRALRKQLPAFDVEEALRVPLPDGNEDAALRTPVSLPSSRIAKSPLRGAVAGAGMAPVPFSLGGGGGHMVQGFASSATAAVAGGLAASQPARSPPPLSARGVAPPGPTADMAGGRLGSNAEASTSDIGRSMRDQLKAVRLLELQYRVLTVKAEAAARARYEKGVRQLHFMAVLLAQMMKRSVEVQRELVTAQTAARTQHVLDTQLPLLERWAAVQDAHAHATREVLTALQNAMTSLPLVNGAGLGGNTAIGLAMGGGASAAALQQLRSALAKGLGSLQSCEAALRLLLEGSRDGGASQAGAGGAGGDVPGAAGAEAQQPQGGVPAMATLLPRLHETLVGEVCALRSLLEDLNGLAAKMDEGACLRVRMSDCGVGTSGTDTGAFDGGFGFGLDQGMQMPQPQQGCGMTALDRTMDQALQMLDLNLL